MKVKILNDDPSGRFKAGEIGEILQNDFPEKYDYLVRLHGTVHIDNFHGSGSIEAVNELEKIEDELRKCKQR